MAHSVQEGQQLLKRVRMAISPTACGCQNRFGIPFWLVGAPPILEPMIVVGLGCSLGVREKSTRKNKKIQKTSAEVEEAKRRNVQTTQDFSSIHMQNP